MARCCTVTLHAVIDENFTVPSFEPGKTQRAQSATAHPVGKGISCANAVACLGCAQHAVVIVLCGEADVKDYESALARHQFAESIVIPGPPTTRRHVTIIDPHSSQAVTHVQALLTTHVHTNTARTLSL